MRTIVESPGFYRQVMRFWSETDYDLFIDWIARNPEVGDVIPRSGGLRKVRWSRAGMGKQGGVRVIYGVRSDFALVLLVAYVKSKVDNVMPHEVKEVV